MPRLDQAIIPEWSLIPYFKRPSLIPFSELVWHLRILSSYISVGPVLQLQATYDNKSNAYLKFFETYKRGKREKKNQLQCLSGSFSLCFWKFPPSSTYAFRIRRPSSSTCQAVEIMRYGSHVILELTGRVSACIIRESVTMPRRRLISQ